MRKRRTKTISPPKSKHVAKFYKIVPTIIFTLAGLFYLLAPHDLHMAVGLAKNESHENLMVFGAAFLVVGVIFWIVNNKRKVDENSKK